MTTRTIVLLCGLLATLVVGMFTYTYLARENVTPEAPQAEAPQIETPAPYGITRIDAKHFYRDGVHTVVGELLMPTPCDLVTADTLVAESYPEQITLELTVTNTTEVCAQVITAQRFVGTASASEAASWRATLNGVPVDLNLIEAEPGEDPATVIFEPKG